MHWTKQLSIPLAFSLAGHALLLSAAGLFDGATERRRGEILTVHMEAPVAHRPETDTVPEKPPQRTPAPAGDTVAGREDTIRLDNPDRRYAAYLRLVRDRIERRWRYPEESVERREQGVAVVRFSIHRNGSVGRRGIVTSSGSSALDRTALDVVQTAGPYEPLPDAFRLTTLHVVAAFQYGLLE